MSVHRGAKMFEPAATFCYILLYCVHAYKYDGVSVQNRLCKQHLVLLVLSGSTWVSLGSPLFSSGS